MKGLSTLNHEHSHEIGGIADMLESPRHWFDRAMELDLSLNFDNEHPREWLERIYRSIHRVGWRKDTDRQETFFRLMANLLLGLEFNRPIRYSRKNLAYRKRHSGVGRVIVLGLIDEMEEQGLIEQVKGYRNVEDDIQRQTRMWPTKRLVDLCEDLSCEDVIKEPPLSLIQLRHRKTKDPIEYTTNLEVERMIDQLCLYGEKMKSHNLLLHVPRDQTYDAFLREITSRYIYKYFIPRNNGGFGLYTNRGIGIRSTNTIPLHTNTNITRYHTTTTTLHPATRTRPFSLIIRYPWLHRVFNDTFHQGGRFYGAAWQFLSENLREFIMIDGEPTVELDYSGMHLRMLYHLEGFDYKADPYSFGDQIYRPLYKVAALVLINSRKPYKKYEAVRKAFIDEGLNQEFEGCLSKEFIDSIMGSFFNAHEKIKKHCFSDVGVRLQNIDAEITSGIVDHFMRRDISVLPIHDSYIVPARHRDELEWAMGHFYREKLGYGPKIH